MTDKLKVAFYWGASCGGCEIAVLDTNEKILEIAAVADILLWPIAVDGKYKDIEALPDKAVDVCFFNGGVRNSETERIARMLREKSKVMIAFGACASMGGVPGLANLTGREPILNRVYETTVSTINPGQDRPKIKHKTAEGEVELPDLYERVFPLDEIVTVDYYLPGCPPTAEWVVTAIDAIVKKQFPPPGSIIAPEKTLCDECKRERTNERKIKKFYRPHEIIPDPKKCLLEQGIICCGPATRAGCKAACIEANMPCRGCYGAAPGVIDQGIKMLNAVASLIDSENEEEIEKIIADIRDPMGTFYQFGLAKSMLKGNIKAVYTGPEKRKHPRTRGNFFVTYRVLEEASAETVSESKSLSMGGMMLTTNRFFPSNTQLALEMSLPADPNPLMLVGRVIESSEVVKDMVYDTHIEFIAIDDAHREAIGGTVNQIGRTEQ
jgi:F420-non-reducing hydrogenase small subunit